jgi:hypothetical protein
LNTQRRKLLRQARQNDAGGLSTQDHDGLLGERLQNLGSPGFPHARSEFDESVGQLLLTERGQLRRRGIALEQIEHGGMIQVRAHHALARDGSVSAGRGCDCCLHDLACQILVKYPAGVGTNFSAGISFGAQPADITAGPDGNLWFTEPGINGIGRITLAGVVTEFSAGISAGASPSGITAGPDGALWFTEPGVNSIGRITPGSR